MLKSSYRVKLNLQEIGDELTKRLIKLFERYEESKFQYHSDDQDMLFTEDEHFKDHHLLYEFIYGDNGIVLGSSHLIGWIANLILKKR